MIEKTPFLIDFPLNLLSNRKVNFENKNVRNKIFKRNIYYYKYGRLKNPFLEERNKTFYLLAEKLSQCLKKKYSSLEILSISVFGSALYSKNPHDFDFLVIVGGNKFSYDEIKLSVFENGARVEYLLGVSIKGIENLSRGIFDKKSNVSLNFQSQLVYRTAISLFRRHIPILGYDFINNEKIFLKNICAQASDLLNNAYELYYLKNKRSKLTTRDRSRKILSRSYEAISYLSFLKKDLRATKLKKKISLQIGEGATPSESRMIFNRVASLYRNIIHYQNNPSRDRREVLNVLLNNDLKRNIQERLKNYWKRVKLPYSWIDQILKILSKYHYDEDLAIKEVRKKYPQILDNESPDYSKKLKIFRRIKIKNLARILNMGITGEILADVGGRSDDLVEQILILNKKIKSAYVTDLCSFTTRSKNPKVNFIVQSSLTKLPFDKNSINTAILSMVLHHLNNKQQKEMISNLVKYLKTNGRIILIEDTYPKKLDYGQSYDKITEDFLKFNSEDKKRVLYFYDWFGNRLMRNRDSISLYFNYRSMEEWTNLFEGYGMKQIKSEFVQEDKCYPALFPPKAIMVFKRNN